MIDLKRARKTCSFFGFCEILRMPAFLTINLFLISGGQKKEWFFGEISTHCDRNDTAWLDKTLISGKKWLIFSDHRHRN